MATPNEDFTAEAPTRSLQASISNGATAQAASQRSPQASVSNASPPSAFSDDVLSPMRLKSAFKGPNVVAMEPAGSGGKLCHKPVTARSAKDMIGAHTERSTGITYPYNMWGPCNPTRFGPVGEMPPERGHRCNYQGQHETLMKDRLEERNFSHVKHHCYRNNLVEPIGEDSLAYMDPKRKEFWRTDVEKVLKGDEVKRRDKEKKLLEVMTNEEAQRRHNVQKMRDMKYQDYFDLSENMRKVGCQNNLSGAPHINIITREPIGEHNIKAVKFRDDCIEYKRAQRTLMLRERNNGAQNYNIELDKEPTKPSIAPLAGEATQSPSTPSTPSTGY